MDKSVLGGQSNWCSVTFSNPLVDIKDYQMWKISGNSIVSKFNHGTMGIYEGNIFKNDGISAFIGDEQGESVTGAVSVDKSSTSNYEFSITGLHFHNQFL